MIFRRIKAHVAKEDWFAVFIDFIIVVFGVFIGLQVQQWTIERQRQSSEDQYLTRLHDEVEQLIANRLLYDLSRPAVAKGLKQAADILANGSVDDILSQQQCTAIITSSYIIAPPADLPTIGELLSSGRLEQILSAEVRESILNYTLEVSRGQDLIAVLSKKAEDLARGYPSLIQVRFVRNPEQQDGTSLNTVCDTPAMRKNDGFMNEFSINANGYSVYSASAVLPVSRELGALHKTLDQTLGINHNKEETTP